MLVIVALDGGNGHDELPRDKRVRPSLGHQPEHLALTRG